MRVRLSEEARADLLRIGDHIAKDNPLRAREMVRELRIRAMEIGDNPLLSRLFPAMSVPASAVGFLVTISFSI